MMKIENKSQHAAHVAHQMICSAQNKLKRLMEVELSFLIYIERAIQIQLLNMLQSLQ